MNLGENSLGRIRPFTGTEAKDRIQLMFLQVAKSIRHPMARTLLAEAVGGCPARDDWCEVQAIYWIIRKYIRYTGDTLYLDCYQTLQRSIELGIGDCDDHCIALMSILLSGGFKAGAKIISQDGKQFSHVYCVAELPRLEPLTKSNRHIVPLDTTVSYAYPGWEPPKSERKMERLFWYVEDSV